MNSTVCPTCQRKVALPENTTSRTVKTMCPKCGELLPVPPSASRHPQESILANLQHSSTGAELRDELTEAMASLRNLGLLVLGLGLVSLLFMMLTFCLPDVFEYVGVPLSGAGILLGLYGIGRALKRGERGVLYVLGGMAACGLVLALIFSHPWRTVPNEGPQTGGSSILEERQKVEKEPRKDY
jgi:hypothetical protein